MRIQKLFFVISLLTTFTVLAQTDPGKRLKSDVKFLADDLLMGRRTPSEGLDIAALYLSNQLGAYGWQPANDGSYFQTFDIESFDPVESEYRILINGIDLAPEDYIFISGRMDPKQTPIQYDLVFLGQGIFAPEKNIDDYRNVDLQGKAGVALYGAPWEMDLHAIHSCDRAAGKAVQVSVRNGKLLIYVTEELDETAANREIGAEIPMLKEISRLPVASLSESRDLKTTEIAPILMITPEVFDRTLARIAGNSYAGWQKKFIGKQQIKSFTMEARIKITIEANMNRQTTQNVVAAKVSKDPNLGHEWLVLSAHYDHVGAIEAAEGMDGIFNGADDNASGTAAILEVARKISTEDLRRSVMILFSCGEENGLLGSAYFISHPLMQLDKVILNVNADMVGRSSGTLNCINTGSDELYQRALNIGIDRSIKVMPDPFPSWRLVYFIDSFSFARNNIPFIQFMTDFHPDYHQPTDEVQFIKFDELERITELIYEMTKYYANGGERPTFKRPAWFLTAN